MHDDSLGFNKKAPLTDAHIKRTNRQTDKQTNRQTDRQTVKQKNRHKDTQIKRTTSTTSEMRHAH